MPCFLGIDIGTSGTKTLIMDVDGRVLCSKTEEYPLSTPQNGWAEQPPERWWDAAQNTIRAALRDGGPDAGEIAAVGLTGQMHGLVMLDRDDRVLRPAILWCDQRTGAECRDITEAVGAARLIGLTANPALTGFTAPKILWVRKHEPELFRQCVKIMLPKDFIRYKLTGAHSTDVSDASGTGLLNVGARTWSEEVIGRLSLDGGLLGRMYESCEITGHITDEAARLTGLPAGIPVVAGAGDNAAAAIGTGVARDGRAFATIGTSGVVFAHTSRMQTDPKGRVHTFCAAVPGEWHIMGVTLAAGLSLQWLRDVCLGELAEEARAAGKNPYAYMDELAASSPLGGDRLLFLPYLNGERTPHLDPDCRGVFFGLSTAHKQRDLIRAVMEGVSYSLKDCLDIIREMGTNVDELIACGGGGGSAFWRQMLADVFGCAVGTVQSREGPALGAAMLAGVGAGAYPSVQNACERLIRTLDETDAQPENTAAYERVHAVYRSLYQSLRDDFKALAAL